MRNMSRHTVALVSCLFFLVLAELGARAITDVESSQAAGGSEECHDLRRHLRPFQSGQGHWLAVLPNTYRVCTRR